jgi:cytochrome c oxidase assembly protein subunit 15
MLTIGLLVLILRNENRRWMKGFGFAALALVIFQGMLGGMRVLLDERTLAMLHGCTGPVFFAVTVAMTVFTSRTWLSATDSSSSDSAGIIRRLTPVVAVLAYLQIVLGAVVRHVPVDAQPDTFMLAVKFHLFLATVLTLHIVGVAWIIQTRARHIRPLRNLALALVILVLLQVVLGASTWIVKFAVPTWAGSWVSPQSVAVIQGGWTQTHIITAHVAVGSLILGVAVALALYCQRLLVESPLPIVVRRELGAAT